MANKTDALNDRAKISLPIETSKWIRQLQYKHKVMRKIELSLSQIVSRGMDIARKELSEELSRP